MPPPSRREIAFFVAGLAAVIAVMLFLSDGWILFTRPLWVDEVFTVMVARQPTPIDVIAGLAKGSDGGPGLVHLAVWAMEALAGPVTPGALRLMSLLCVVATLTLVYVVLRRTFGRDASVAGALAVGANALVVAHSYEVRFYGPWLLCSAFVAYALSRRQERAHSRATAVLLAFATVLLCTVHFFGVISLALMCAAVVASYRRDWRGGLRCVTPCVVALPTVAAIAPIALGIRGYLGRTWVPPLELAHLEAVAARFWFAEVPLLAATTLAIAIPVQARRGAAGRSVSAVWRAAMSDAGVVALAALALMPVALALVSLLGQSAMIPRYATVTALAWGPLTALALEVAGRTPAKLARIVILWFWFAAYTIEASVKMAFARALEQTANAVRQVEPSGLPVVFQLIYSTPQGPLCISRSIHGCDRSG